MQEIGKATLRVWSSRLRLQHMLHVSDQKTQVTVQSMALLPGTLGGQVGFFSNHGWEEKKTMMQGNLGVCPKINQDRIFVTPKLCSNDTYLMLAVFDGNGPKGHFVAQAAGDEDLDNSGRSSNSGGMGFLSATRRSSGAPRRRPSLTSRRTGTRARVKRRCGLARAAPAAPSFVPKPRCRDTTKSKPASFPV